MNPEIIAFIERERPEVLPEKRLEYNECDELTLYDTIDNQTLIYVSEAHAAALLVNWLIQKLPILDTEIHSPRSFDKDSWIVFVTGEGLKPLCGKGKNILDALWQAWQAWQAWKK